MTKTRARTRTRAALATLATPVATPAPTKAAAPIVVTLPMVQAMTPASRATLRGHLASGQLVGKTLHVRVGTTLYVLSPKAVQAVVG